MLLLRGDYYINPRQVHSTTPVDPAFILHAYSLQNGRPRPLRLHHLLLATLLTNFFRHA